MHLKFLHSVLRGFMNDFRLRDCQIGKEASSIQGSIAIQLILTTDCAFAGFVGIAARSNCQKRTENLAVQ